MKRILLSTFMAFICLNLFAQCDELFISEYVEGYSSNKALEIYNPTNAAINLSGYSLARFSNGATVAPSDTKVIPLPNVMLEAHDVFVVVLDKTDMSLWCSDLDKPVWDGTNVIDILVDEVTMEPFTDSEGNPCHGPQYNEDFCALFGDTYDEYYDLQCKADAFLCPVYSVNNTMYFNGNDAMALISGTEVTADGSNILDVIGVIGEDPEATLMEDAWVDENGSWLTKDKTLIRNSEVTTGRNNFNDVIAQLGGTFTGTEWTSTCKNSFQHLGIHESACNDNNSGVTANCAGEPTFDPIETECCRTLTSNKEIAIPVFKMFPNPNTTGLLSIEAAEQIQSIEISNMLGQKVYNQQVTNVSTNTTVNTSNLNKGIFVVNIMFNNNIIATQRLVIK